MMTFDQARQHPNYGKIPADLLAELYNYVENHDKVTPFLRAVLYNDPVGAARVGSAAELSALKPLVAFIFVEVPAGCYGSQQTVDEWLRVITWTAAKLKRFKVAYQAAGLAGSDTFVFDDNEFVVGYAKYLIEYLESLFSTHARA
jgi:hypothetical protein